MYASNRVNAGSVLRAFEIHTYQGGRWKIDSVFDDRDLAVFEAERMDISGRYPGVRVIEGVFDEASNTTTSRTVYRGVKVAKANEETFQKSELVRKEVGEAREERKAMNTARQAQIKRRAMEKKTNPVRLVMILLLLCVFAVGSLFGLAHLDKLM